MSAQTSSAPVDPCKKVGHFVIWHICIRCGHVVGNKQGGR